jgi:hypothetical protein
VWIEIVSKVMQDEMLQYFHCLARLRAELYTVGALSEVAVYTGLTTVVPDGVTYEGGRADARVLAYRSWDSLNENENENVNASQSLLFDRVHTFVYFEGGVGHETVVSRSSTCSAARRTYVAFHNTNYKLPRLTSNTRTCSSCRSRTRAHTALHRRDLCVGRPRVDLCRDPEDEREPDRGEPLRPQARHGKGSTGPRANRTTTE